MISWSRSAMRIFCWAFASSIVLAWALGRYLHPGKADLQHSSFVIRHSIDFLMLNGATVLLVWPILIDKGILRGNCHEEDEVGKAKSVFLLNGMLLPGVSLLLIGTFLTHQARVPASMLFLGFVYLVLKNGYLLFNSERKSKK